MPLTFDFLGELVSAPKLPTPQELVPVLERLFNPEAEVGQFYRIGYEHADSPYATFQREVIPEEEWAPLPETTLARMRSGVEFEGRVFDQIVAGMDRPVVVIEDNHDAPLDEKRLREAETLLAIVAGVRAMREGRPLEAPIILGGRLPAVFVPRVRLNLVGKPDILVPDARRRTYVFCDVKESSTLEGSGRPQEWLVSPEFRPLLSEATRQEVGSGVPKRKHRYQLAHYYLMATRLFRLLGIPASPMSGIVGRDGRALWVSVREGLYGRGRNKASALDEYLALVEDWRRIHELGVRSANGEAVVLPAEVNAGKRPACSSCPFREHCAAERARTDDLTRHPDIGHTQVPTLAAVLDEPTVAALASADVDALTERYHAALGVVPGVTGFGQRGDEEATWWRFRALVDQARSMRSGEPMRRRDQARIPRLEAVVELHVDLENITSGKTYPDGRVIPGGYLAQTGVVLKTGVDALDNVHTRYTTWIPDGTSEGEEEALASWWRYVARKRKQAQKLYDDLKAEYGADALAGIAPFRIFTYTKAEHRIWRAKGRQFADNPDILSGEDLEEILEPVRAGRPESAEVVDLHEFVRTYLHLPLEDRRLKTVARYVGFSWRVDDPSGDLAALKISELYGPDAEAAAAADRWLRSYNRDDCYATLAVRRWLDTRPIKAVEIEDARDVFAVPVPQRAPWPKAA